MLPNPKPGLKTEAKHKNKANIAYNNLQTELEKSENFNLIIKTLKIDEKLVIQTLWTADAQELKEIIEERMQTNADYTQLSQLTKDTKLA